MYAFHLLRYSFPLLFLYLISKYLSTESIAKILSAQSLSLMLSQLLEYGFGIYATRGISTQGDASGRNATVNTVYSAQFILVPLAVVLSTICFAVSPLINKDLELLIPLVVYMCALGLTPMWYFHGRLEFRRAASIEGFSLTISLSLLLFLVLAASSTQASVILWAVAAGPVVTTTYGWWCICRETRVVLSLRDGARALYTGFPIFVMKAATVTYTAGSVWIAGLICSDYDTARFGAVMKLIAAASSLAIPLSQVIMPFASRGLSEHGQRSLDGSKRLGYVLFLVPALALTSLLYIFSALICSVLLKNAEYTETFRLALLMLFPIAVTMCLFSVVHIPMGRERILSRITLLGGAVILCFSYELGRYEGADGLVTARILGEVLICLLSLGITRNVNVRSALQPR